ncbi:alpha/beta hydrolase [Marinomonas ostreistagni]|uniref:alpha/beta hydrolase n=1 Tax=Marinomonas ostreistagni TaxID=359209 RepID=UPI00194DDB4C|nr:alpha/beta fold hydrolase [Marinomonas ostreistagni]MBM6552284.1 alpha/beta fold hydrolase [Marinomonas ostreistagni]
MLSRWLAIGLMAMSALVSAQDDVAVQQTGEPFSEYRERLSDYFWTHKAWVDANNKTTEVAAVLPFEYQPDAERCATSDSVGLLLFHGLSDSPFTLRDPAKALSEYCVHTRVMLLPGHGSKAEDLIDIERDSWRKAVAQAVKEFAGEVDQVYLGGFSTGGALVTEYAWQHADDIEGVVLFSPLFKINSGIDWLAPWLAPFIDWLDHHPTDDYAKYASIPVPAIAQAYSLAKEVRQTVATSTAPLPVFIALSAEDATVDSEVTLEVYRQSMAVHSGSRLTLYSTQASQADNSEYEVVNSVLPEQRIHGLSHISVHGAPDNPYYGAQGSYRQCGWYLDDKAQYDACRHTPHNWFGERSAALTERSNSAARLTWNPYFAELMQQVATFMEVADVR